MRAIACLAIVTIAVALIAPEQTVAFDESGFREAVSRALGSVKQVLDTTRNPVLAAPEVAHAYSDKYVLAEFTTNTAIAAHLNALEALGLSDDALQRLLQAVHQHRTVTLRLNAEERCKHLRTITREVESPSAKVTTYGLGLTTRETVVTKVTEYFWQFDVSYELIAFRGAGTSEDVSVTLQKRWATTELKTLSEQRPRPEVTVRPPIDVDITWLLRHTRVSSAHHKRQTSFAIERADSARCHTPRRNPQTDAAIASFNELMRWSNAVRDYFLNSLLPTQQNHGLDLSAASDVSTLFVPVAPLFEATAESAKAMGDKSRDPTDGTGIVPLESVNKFLEEQALRLRRKRDALAKAFPTNGNAIVSLSEAWLALVLKHMTQISRMAIDAVDYVESMLYAQLRSAIGKDLQPIDFQHFARFHMRKLYRDVYQPRAFTYAVRRPSYSPEGVVSIEAAYDDGSAPDPIHTIVSSAVVIPRNGITGSNTHVNTTGVSGIDSRHTAGTMYFALDATRRVAFNGERHVHGWINQQFSGSSGLQLNLIARARQFSAFILMVGRITSANTFEAKHAMIIQNKDDLKIPLLLETIPTPKEFRDAIESLSPEQQRFAKGYRAMQLESTLFAVCIVQIKPALEKVLNLPDDALTKEIELTQDLLELFIEYQIPSDLLSYSAAAGGTENGAGADTARHRIAVVRGYATKMKELVQRSKVESLKESAMRTASAVLEGTRERARVELHSDGGGARHVRAYGARRASAGIEALAGGVMDLFSNLGHAHERAVPLAMASMASVPTGSAPPTHSLDAIHVDTGFISSPPPPPPTPPSPPQNSPADPATASKAEPTPIPTQTQAKAKANAEEDQPQTAVVVGVDYTTIPTRLERAYEELDTDGALRPTIVNPSNSWTKRSQKTLLADPQTDAVGVDVQGRERSRAFDLIDALTKSGDPRLALDHAALHVFIAATHCFDKTLVDTVIQQNVNPIERVERSSLIVASTIHGVAPRELVQPHQLSRLAQFSPRLIPSESPSTASTDGVRVSGRPIDRDTAAAAAASD